MNGALSANYQREGQNKKASKAHSASAAHVIACKRLWGGKSHGSHFLDTGLFRGRI